MHPQTLDEHTHQAVARLLPEVTSALLRNFAVLWLSKRRGRPMPTFADMDPVEMPWALNTVFVLRRRNDGLFAYGLVGQGMIEQLGGSLRGKTAFDVFEPEYAAWTESRWQRAAAGPECCYVRTNHQTVDGMPLSAERILMPLAGTGKIVDDMIGVAEYRKWSGEDTAVEGQQPFVQTIWTPIAELPEASAGKPIKP